MVQTAGIDRPPARVVDELEGHELVPRKLQHGEAAERGLRHVSEDLVTQPGVEGERPLQVGDAEADVQRPHPEVPRTTGHPPTCASSPTSSRQAQCSAIDPPATRQMWMKSQATAFPVGGRSASSGIVDATWRPCIVRGTTTRSPSATTRWMLAVGWSRSPSSIASVVRRPSRPCGPAACWTRSSATTSNAELSRRSRALWKAETVSAGVIASLDRGGAPQGHVVRAGHITRFGGPEVLEIVDVRQPTPSSGQQLYDVS